MSGVVREISEQERCLSALSRDELKEELNEPAPCENAEARLDGACAREGRDVYFFIGEAF